MELHGFDLSHHNGNINIKGLYPDFLILRAGYGRQANTDKKFNDYYNTAKELGIPVGAYWYSYATNEYEAELEAKACLSTLKGKQFEFPVYYDIEEKSALAIADKVAKKFCDILESEGYFVGIYASKSPLENQFSDSVTSRYSLWIAEWNKTACTYTRNPYGMWQSKVDKLSDGSEIDVDVAYLDFPSIIKKRGLNGYALENKPVELSNDERQIQEYKDLIKKIYSEAKNITSLIDGIK